MLLAVGCSKVPAQVVQPAAEESTCAAPTEAQWGGTPLGVADEVSSPRQAITLMGGGPEDDRAMAGFLEDAAGGDVLVLRASGSVTSYPDYFGGLDPQPAPRSARVLKIPETALSVEESVRCLLDGAEALWFAGGDQWNYLGGWPASLRELLRLKIGSGVAFGGISAGAAIAGEGAFDAESGTISSEEALRDPASARVSVSLSSLGHPDLDGFLVDSHFSEREREGRLLAFLARYRQITGDAVAWGLGLDERTAIRIVDGRFKVFSSGGAVWLYALRGPARVVEGYPLEASDILRVRWPEGTEGPWPPSEGTWTADTLRVISGVVQPAG